MSLTDTLKKIKQGSTYAGAVNYTAPTVNVAPRNEPANNLVNSLRQIRQGNIGARDVSFDMSGAAKRDSLLYSRVNDFLTNSNKSYVKGNWNVKNWQKQYDTLMSDIDRYGETMEPSYKSALKAAMDETKKRMVPTQVSIQGYSRSVPTGYNEETGAPNRFRQEQATPFQLNQNLLTNATPGQLSYENDRMNFNRAGVDRNGNVVPTSVPNTAFARLNQLANQKIQNDAALRDLAYYQSKGAPMDNYSNRDLQALQGLYKNLAEQDKARQGALDKVNVSGTLSNYTYSQDGGLQEKPIEWAIGEKKQDTTQMNRYEGVKMPGKDDLEDYGTKFDRIKQEHPDWSDDQVDDFIQNGEREDYTIEPVKTSAYNTDQLTGATKNIQTELGRREFWSKYAPFFQEEDFKEKSKPAYNIPAEYIPDYRDEQARNEMSEDDLEGLFIASINGNEQAREFLHYRSGANGEKTPYSYRYDRFGTDKEIYMNDDEVAMFNYLLNTQGKEAAMEFYDGLSDALDARKSAAVDEEWQQLTREAPFFANVATTLLKPVTTAGSGLEQLYQLVTTGSINADDPAFHYTGGVNTVRGTTADIIREGGGDVLAFLYNTGMSVIDNVYDMALGAGVAKGLLGITGSAANKVTQAFTLGIMSTDAAQNATLDNLRNGQDTVSALVNGAAAGIIEFLTERIGLENLFSSRWMNKSKWISNMLSQMGAEGSEEALSKVMNWGWGAAYDTLTGQTTSEWTRDINAYIIENGLAPNDQQKAFEHVFAQKMGELGEETLSGTISGGMIGGPGIIRGSVELNNQVRNIMPADSYFRVNSDADLVQVQALIDEAKSYDPKSAVFKKASKLQTLLDRGPGLTVEDNRANIEKKTNDLYEELVKADVLNESHAAPELSSIDRSGETRPQTAFPMQGPSVNVPAATAQKFIPQDLYLSALAEATNQDNTTTGVTGIDSGEAETLISDIFNAGLEGEMTEDVASRARAFLDQGYTDAIYQAGVQARDTNRQTAFGPTFNMPAQEMVQRDQLIEDVASGYDSAGRTSMGEVMRAFNPFRNHAVTDMSTADYVSEISAVYNAAAQNQEIPPTPHLTQQAAQAAINAAKMDRIYLDEGITSAEQAEMEASEETNAAVRPAEYTPVEKTAEQRDTDYESVLDYAGEVSTADGQETFGDVVANNYYDDMDANAYTAGAQAILEQAQQGVPLEDVTLPAQAQKFISPQLKAELYNAVNTQEALGNAVNTQEVTNGTEESGNVPVLGSSGRVNSTDTGIQSEAVAGGTEQTETAGNTVNVRTDVRNAFHLTGQTATAQSLGIETGTETNTVQIVELDDSEENNQLREIATAAHKKLVTFVGNNLSTGAGDARGIIKGDTIYVRADHPRFTPLQIAKHEVMHGELRNDTNHKINSVLNHLRSLFGGNFVDNRLIPAYKSRYAASGLSDLRVLEELICDIYGEMNEWNMKDLPGMEEAYNRFLSKGAQITHEIVRNINQTAEAVTEVRNNGPPAEENKFSMEAPVEETENLIKLMDSDYMAAVNAGDMETAQRMVTEAAGKAGYNSPILYHGTAAFGFTVIDPKMSNDRISFFATDSAETAGTYSGTHSARIINDGSGSNLGMYQLYANTSGMLELDAKGAESNHIELGKISKDYNEINAGRSFKTYATAKQVAKYAKQSGYTGVIIRDVVDTATPESRRNVTPSSVYVFFNPQSQVKSADPVTYDDAGNVIPLSERFNTENPDIRYSTETDRWLDSLIIDDIIAEIQKNLDASENQKAQRRVDEVNKRLKQIGLQFTGTKEAAWTDDRIDMYLGGGWYGADGIPNYAQAHIAYMTPQQYLNLTMGTNTATVDRIENETAEYGDVDFTKLGDSAPIRLYIDKGRNGARVTGHEGRHRMMMLGRAGFSRVPVLLFDSSDKYEKTTLTNYTLRPQTFGSDKLISRGRNVTLDEMIPFSQGNRDLIKEKFGSGNANADIRYSNDMKDNGTIVSKSQEDVAADLKKRVTQLEKKAEYFKGQTKLSALTPGSAAWKNMKPLINEYQAKKILRSVQDFYGSTTDVSAFTKDIQRLVTYLASRSNGNKFEIVNEAVYHIAKKIVENTQVIVEDDGSEILKDIRKTTIKVSPRVQHDIADYNKWRMSHFGKMKMSTNKGTDVTEYYNELTERFGEAAFPSDINTATDQLLYIADFVDNYQPITQNPYSYDMAAVTQDAALTLYNEILNADLFKPTYADKQNARIEKLQKESAERVQEVRRQARQQREDQIQKIKDHAKEIAYRRRWNKAEQNARQKLIRLARRLNGMKTTKANRALIDELIGNLDTVAYSLTEGKATNLMELNAWYETQKETNPDFVAHADLVQKQLARLTQTHIADMTVSEILDLTKSLMTLENDIRTQNKLINSKMNEDALQAGIKAIRDIDNARGIDKGLRRTIDNLIVQGTLSPTRFMHRLTGYNDSDPLYQAVAGEDGLAGGQRKMLDYQYRAGKLFEEWLSDRKFTRWFTGTKAEILSYDIVTADGQQRTIQMTPAMRTTLYLAAMDKGWMQHMCGRDTMDKHIAGGGIVLPDIKSYRKGNIADAYDSGTVKVKLTKSFLDKLGQDMTEQELKFAKAIHDYFSGMSKNEINAVSELLLGRSIAEVGDYLPISVDKNFLDAEYGAIKYDGTITGLGSLQERQSSYKPVIVRDITDILKQSIESTSKYVGLAIPIRNFNKIMGVTVGHTDENGVYQNFEGSVLESIANKWGKKAQTYIENMVSDLQTPNNSQEDLEKMFAKIRSKYAGAVLTLNASVALKQAASYPTAAAVLGWKPLMQAFQNPGHVDLNFIAKWTPLQWYRTKGFSTTELGDIQNQNNIFANMPKGLNWIQGMDLITTRKLWKAAEYYVRDNNPELYKKGAGERGQSDAFYRAVADIYNKTIEETQPNYTALQRPEYLRSKSGLVRTLMMFKTQPMQNFNVIYDAVGDFQAKRAQYRNNSDSAEAQQAYEESGKRLRRAVTSQIGQLLTFAAMTMLWNMFRRKKEKYTDEEGNVSLAKIAESMGKDVGSGVFGMIPFGSEVWSFVSSKIFGDKYYGFESVTDSAISDFLNAGSSAWELIGKIIEDDEPFNITTYKKKLKTVLSSASKIMGVPFDNLYNTVTAGYMRGRDLVDGLFHGNKNLADYWALSWTEDASKDKAEFFDILYNAHMDGKEGEYEEILQLMIDSGEYGDKPEETIADGLQDAFVKHTTHVKGETDSDAKYRLYDYMYHHQEDADYEKLHEDALFFGFTEDDIEKGIRNSLAAELIGVPSNEFNKDGLYGHLYSIFDTPEYKEKHDTLTENGWTEDEITDGLKKAYGVQLTGIDSSDYKNADLFTYLYDMKQTNSAGYTAATKEMKKIGYTDDNITDGMKKAYGMQVTGVTEEYSTAVLFDYLYDLKKNHVSNYNAELTKMKGVGFTDKNISDGMKDAYGRAVTGLGSDYTSEALYTTVYKNNKSSLSGKVSEMKGFGFSEQSIRDGLKQAYAATATGLTYQNVRMDDVYDYIYGLYSNNSTKFTTEYQTMLNVGFTEKAIKDGIEARMKEAYGVDNVKKLPHRFAAPDHTLPSYWTYKNDDKDTGPVKESGTVTGSSHVGGYEYDNGELTIYMNGRPYTYHGVPESVFEDFKAAGSKGGFVNDYIKGKYSYN